MHTTISTLLQFPAMDAKVLILGIYVLAVLVIGFIARRKAATSPTDYYLAGRNLSPLILLATIAATNFSAFTIFGCSGEGYRAGLSFLPIMAFGTGFMALTFWLIGRKAWQLSKQHGLITPAELVGKIYNNRWLSLLFALVMVYWTIPYLALQPIAGGIVLNELFSIPQYWGAVIVTGVIVLYTLRGGLRAVAWTDALQGVLMLGLLITALVVIAGQHGGVISALGQAYEQTPELFSRPGVGGKYAIGVYFSMILLWFFCDPMFPQLFQRFMAAKNERALAFTMASYPVICTVVFSIPIIIGVIGHLSIPGLEGKGADQILPKLMTMHGGEALTALVLVAGLAALMSTMDSQLLTLSSIVSRDVLPGIGIDTKRLRFASQIFVVLLACAGLAIATNPQGSILKVGLYAFTGLAGLFPAVLFGLYLKQPSPIAAITSILSGQAVLLCYNQGWLKASGFLPALPVIAVSLTVFVVVQLMAARKLAFPAIKPRILYLSLGCLLVFILAMDFWNWARAAPMVLGLPLWVWYSFALSGILTVLMLVIPREFSQKTSSKGNTSAESENFR